METSAPGPARLRVAALALLLVAGLLAAAPAGAVSTADEVVPGTAPSEPTDPTGLAAPSDRAAPSAPADPADPAGGEDTDPEPSTPPSGRIIGGTTAPPGAWPSQVAVVWAADPDSFSAHFCGGTLVERSWVLTAAHCVREGAHAPAAAQLEVLVGTQDLTSGGTRLPVAEIRVHPDWDDASFRNDVALLRLADPAPQAVPLQPFAAPGASPPTGSEVVVTGWGTRTEGAVDKPTLLEQVTVSVTSDATCSAGYGPSYDPTSMVCAAAPGKDACQGDSGGPMVRHDGSRWVQVGVVSTGSGCALAGFPGIYARLGTFSAWVSGEVRYGPHPHASAFVRATYRDLYDREPSGRELLDAVVALDGGLSPAGWVLDRLQGPTYTSRTGGVTRLYRAAFVRRPDLPGLLYWWRAVNGGTSLRRVADVMAASAELRERYGDLDDRAFVTQVYDNVLDRSPGAQELGYWVEELRTGRMSRGRVLLGFSESPEHRTAVDAEVAVITAYFGLVRRVPPVADVAFWAGRSPGSLVTTLLRSAEHHRRA